MLYTEFLDGTGASASAYNYSVFCKLDNLYMMNDSITKADIYAMGKKLVELPKVSSDLIDNARREIAESDKVVEHYKERIKTMRSYIEISAPEEAKLYKDSIKAYREQIKREKSWIAKNKFFLNGLE